MTVSLPQRDNGMVALQTGATLGAVPQLRRLALSAADQLCLRLAATHDENFTSVTRLLPAAQRLHLARVYAYCRVTDDLGDEGGGDATPALRAWREAVIEALDGSAAPGHPVLLALAETVRIRSLPVQPFLDLVDANLQDQRVAEYQTWEQLLDYCRLSAAPVGRMVLGVVGAASAETERLSDDVCIGLQLANFAQDVARDRAKGRTYLVAADLAEVGLSGAVRRMCDRAAALLRSGEQLEELVAGRTRLQLSLYRLGGLAIVAAVRRCGYTTDRMRPTVGTARKLALVASGLPLLTVTRRRPDAASRQCAAIARRCAGNFYWGFVTLPAEQRHGIYALYAFARQVDDAVDECADGRVAAAAAVAVQRQRLRSALGGEPDDAVSRALVGAVRRHAIPAAELEALVDGVECDLSTTRYADWEQLSGYCGLVASTIGRMCVRVFGFGDSAALERADELGMAMQLVNVLRDVREDARRDRLYLPLADLARFGIDADEVLAGNPGPGWEGLVDFEAARARALFTSGSTVTEHIPRRAAACVRTMAGIYERLLTEVERSPRAPLQRRLSLPPHRKLATMVRAWR